VEPVEDAIEQARRRSLVKYVMLIADTPAGLARSDEERKAWYAEVVAWYEKWGATSKMPDPGTQLQPPAAAKTIRAGGVTDGPYIETKEVLGGYSVLETETIDEAVEIARTWPGIERGWITIEVRPVVPM
jgi:hypothetical protein